MATPRQLVEFRNYCLVPGGLDAFVDHFEQCFLESQEELGMDIVGQFRVIGDPDRFVWIRRYLQPSSRGDSLARFYEGPVWREFGPRANDLMVAYDDVHLLVPDGSLPNFASDHVPHDARDGRTVEAFSTVVGAFFDIEGASALEARVVEAMGAALARVPQVSELGRLVTACGPNDYPRLPVHEDVHVALWLLSDSAGGAMATASAEGVAHATGLPVRSLRLTPTARSTLR